jgi:hypothetical protein
MYTGEIETLDEFSTRLPESTANNRGAIMRIVSRAISLLFISLAVNVHAANLTIPGAGRVSIELINAFADFDNTLSINSPAGIAIAFTGCQLQPAGGLGGLHVVSEENSQRGCRVDLDADAATPGIQDFAAGTTFDFGMCAQTDADDACEFVWSSDPANNSDGEDHVLTANFATNAWRLSWEDLENLGDSDFNDLIVVFRVQQDTDGDGLWDDWETTGIDTNGDGAPEITLPGADPQRKDLYVEVDCLVSDGNSNGSTTDPQDHSHCPRQDSMIDVVTAFANAPVNNPDGTVGIQLHVDVGTLYGAGVTSVNGTGGVTGVVGDLGGGGDQIDESGNEVIDWDGAAGRPGTSFYTLKTANFDNDRRFAYRYGIMAHQVNARRATNDCTSGWAEAIGGNDFIVSLGGLRDLDGNGTGDTGCWASTAANGIDEDGDGAIDEDPRDGVDNDGDCVPGTDTDGDGFPCEFGDIGVDEDGGFSVGSRAQQAGTFMHEFGHTLALGHGGGDGANNKPNYLSVMNYRSGWQFCAVPASAAAGGAFPGACTFSSMVLPPTAAGSLDETSLDECLGIDDGSGWFGAMDWDGGGLSGVTNCNPPNNTNVQADIDVNGSNTDILNGYDDWGNILYAFQNVGAFVNGISSPIDDELTPQIFEQVQHNITIRFAPAISLDLVAPATALPGDTVRAVANIINTGRGPGTKAELTLTTPFGDTETFDLDVLRINEERTPGKDFSIANDACPEVLESSASLTYRDFANNEFTLDDTAQVEVLDITPPVLSVVVMPDQLWPPNHKLADINASITVTDECDPNPQVRLVSITSSEPDDGLGDGHTAEDIQDAAFGTDDRAFRLRRERSGLGDSRVYTIVYEATDASGNATQQTVTVEVAL